jgi:CxxC-x17-CxxC domain-containing protein
MRRQEIEDKVLKWSGMESGPVISAEDREGEEAAGEEGVERASSFLYPRIETAEELAEKSRGEGEEKSEENGGPTEYLRFSPDRLAAIAKSAPAGNAKKKDKPKFKHTCSRCGAVWEMPIQLDPTRPMYCSECLPLIREEQKVKGKVIKAAVSGRPPEGLELEEMASEAPAEPKKKGSLEAAMRAIEDGGAVQIKKKAPPEPNRPRIVVEDRSRFAEISNTDEDEANEDDASPLLLDIAEHRGVPVDTRQSMARPPKEVDVPRRADVDDARPAIPQRMNHELGGEFGEDRRKRKRKHRDRPMPEEKRRDSLDRHFSRVEGDENHRETIGVAREPVRPDRVPSAQSERHHDDDRRPPEHSAPRSSFASSNAPRIIPSSPRLVRDNDSDEIAQHKNSPIPRVHSGQAPRLHDSPTSQLDNPAPAVNHGDEEVSDSSKTVFRAQRPSSPPPAANRPTVIQGGMRVQPGQRITFDS